MEELIKEYLLFAGNDKTFVEGQTKRIKKFVEKKINKTKQKENE